MKNQPASAGSALLAALALCTLTAVPAKVRAGYALSFDGVNQYVTVNIPALANNYTVCAWVYLRSGGDLFANREGLLTSPTCGYTTELLVRSQSGSATDPQYLELGRCRHV